MLDFFAKSFETLTAGQVYEILKSRSEIFMIEQNIRCLDMDDVDYKSIHCFLDDGNRVVAYLRAFYDEALPDTVHIGRVLSLRHNEGLGTELMKKSLHYIQQEMPCAKVVLHSQAYIRGFYEKFGFNAVGALFLEEGIEHVEMQREIFAKDCI